MKRLISLAIAATLISLVSCKKDNEQHFITDEAYRSQVETDFEARKELAQGRSTELFSVFDDKLSLEETEALKFLYAYMPYSDLADYDGEFFLNQVKYAFQARDFFSWGKTVPEDIFRHFVLVYRVNNENLDTARMFIFNEIKDRIKDMSMYDAALEVNHWCHEKVCYRASDARTSAPLATIRTSFGRCGEESTFTVTALRAVGIPARQCYTPRWAHTDDNHAWVEVWVDGKWYFLGACEPDAKLDMGWFAAPSTRCMMVHSNAFGKYKGDEEINFSGELFAKINMLPNYTDTKKITVTVTDESGNPVENAKVKFKLYNYAEYYPISSGETDSEGKASLTTGLGDLLIWASKEGKYDYAKIDVRKNDAITLKLNRKSGKEYEEDFDIVPPAGRPVTTSVTPDEADKNNKRLSYEDSLRNAYTATFPTKESLQQLKGIQYIDQERLWELVHKSEGNYQVILDFIMKHGWHEEEFDDVYDYLKAYSDKDLRDITYEVLESHFSRYDWINGEPYSRDMYKKGILPARISNEMVRPYREELSCFKGMTAEELRQWTLDSIVVDDSSNYYNCPISPVGVYKLRRADRHSRDIFFVAACRSMNIPAYLDNATRQIFVYDNNEWQIVAMEDAKPVAKTGKLILKYNGTTELKPQYWTHYTIAKFEDGDFTTFDYEDDPRVAQFPVELELEEGYYMLSTGNRYSDGEVLSHLEFFNIKQGETMEREVKIRPLVQREKEFYGFISSDSQIEVDGKTINLNDLTKEKPLVLCFIDPIREPTKHILKEFGAMRETYEKWGGNILMAVPAEKLTEPFSAEKWNLPKQTIVTTDTNGLMEKILTDTKQQFNDNLPLIFIVETNGKITFRSDGYRIGTAELIYKELNSSSQD